MVGLNAGAGFYRGNLADKIIWRRLPSLLPTGESILSVETQVGLPPKAQVGLLPEASAGLLPEAPIPSESETAMESKRRSFHEQYTTGTI